MTENDHVSLTLIQLERLAGIAQNAYATPKQIVDTFLRSEQEVPVELFPENQCAELASTLGRSIRRCLLTEGHAAPHTYIGGSALEASGPNAVVHDDNGGPFARVYDGNGWYIGWVRRSDEGRMDKGNIVPPGSYSFAYNGELEQKAWWLSEEFAIAELRRYAYKKRGA